MDFRKAEFCASYGNFSQIPKPQRLEIAFAGRSNVGKSSLINRIFGRKNLARVSSVPGKTATINFYGLENVYGQYQQSQRLLSDDEHNHPQKYSDHIFQH